MTLDWLFRRGREDRGREPPEIGCFYCNKVGKTFVALGGYGRWQLVVRWIDEPPETSLDSTFEYPWLFDMSGFSKIEDEARIAELLLLGIVL